MKRKKVLMIIVLIAFLGVVGFLIVNVGKKTEEKKSEISQISLNTISSENNTNIVSLTNTAVANSNTVNTEITQNSGIVRKSEGKPEIDTNNILTITDNYFIQQANDLYYNINEYLGTTIKIEGFIYYYTDENGDTCYAIVRNSPGCCGNDGLAGVDIRYDEDYPEKDTWVEVVGVLDSDTTFGRTIPVIKVNTMTEKEEGVTFVTN